jgi:hypothetical protein
MMRIPRLDLLKAGGTGMPILDAQADFRRARRRYAAARLRRWLLHGSEGRRPVSLAAAVPVGGSARLEVIPLRRIVGTVEPTQQFDGHFRPASEIVRARWERIALARRTGVWLPPIVVQQRTGGYYVVDGRHRVSVARAFGDPDIEAWVVGARAGSSDSSEQPSRDRARVARVAAPHLER